MAEGKGIVQKTRLVAGVIQSQNDFRLKDQSLGSSSSIMNDIAEGFERQAP